jgi:TPR repeat protein
MHQQACDGGIASACVSLGVALTNGRGIAADVSRAALLFQRGCDAGNALMTVSVKVQ